MVISTIKMMLEYDVFTRRARVIKVIFQRAKYIG